MANFSFDSGMNLTRRELARIAGLSGLGLSAASMALAADFWTNTKASDWTEAQIAELRKKSPWAKQYVPVVGSAATSGGGGRGNNFFQRQGGGGGGRGGGGAGGGRGPQGFTIIWESAKPMRESSKAALPEKLAGNYVIGVVGITPMLGPIATAYLSGTFKKGDTKAPPVDAANPPDATTALMTVLKADTSLDVKGKAAISPATIMQFTGGTELLFAFPMADAPLTKDSKDVEFHIKVGALEVKAKFTPKEMIYEGELAV